MRCAVAAASSPARPAVKIVSMSMTTTDSGLHFLGKWVNGGVPADWNTDDGVQSLNFGDTVRVLHNYAKEKWTTATTLAVTINPGDRVVKAFERVGWEWGGYWSGAKDYQHFSKGGG